MKAKKLCALLLTTAIMFSSVFVLFNVSAATLDDFSYELTSDGITITKYNGNKENLTIPECYEINGKVYSVLSVGKYAFENSAIKSIKIPDSVTKIEEGAFYNCDNLLAVTIPSAVATIGKYAFDDCNSLTNVIVLNSNAVIGESAFGFYYSGRQYYVVENFVMYGLKGSTAQKYATDNSMTFAIYEKPVLGDVNNDKKLDVLDLVRLKKILAGIIKVEDGEADVNGDGICSAEDMVCMITLLICGEENLETYTVTFKDKNGNILDIQKVKHSFSAIAPEAPEVDGYIFKAWSKAFANVTSDIEVVATYVADTKPSFVVDKVSAKQGDKQVTIAVSVKNNPGILGMTLSVEYDETALALVDASNGAALTGVLSFTKANTLKSGCNFVWDGQEITTESIRNGNILLLTFNVLNNVPSGEYPINISYRAGDIIDGNLESIAFEIVNGKITVS